MHVWQRSHDSFTHVQRHVCNSIICLWCLHGKQAHDISSLWVYALHSIYSGLHCNRADHIHWCNVVGAWANQVSHPSYGITKEYVVTTNQPANKKQLKDLEQGCTIEGVEVKPVGIAVEMSDPSKRNKLRIVIAEGRNREVTMHYLTGQSLQCHSSDCEAVW